MSRNVTEQGGDWSWEAMQGRQQQLFAEIRRCFRPFVNSSGEWQSPPAVNALPDPRVLVEVALPYLQGDKADRELACRLIGHPLVQARINRCAFTSEYLLAAIYCAGADFPEDLREDLRRKLQPDLLARYSTKDLQHHGYNDNHVTLATSTLILGGQFTNNAAAIEQGRYNLLNFRDTFLRRGFMHETNDCYIPHTLYTIAIVAEFAEDAEIRELARNCELRIWIDWLSHWHHNLARKPGPSARDYTGGRLNPNHISTALWAVFGDRFTQPVYPPRALFADAPAPEQFFRFNGSPADNTWNLGFIARFAAHPYHLTPAVAALAYEKNYPHIVCGTHEVGNATENITRFVYDPERNVDVMKNFPIEGAIPCGGREIFTYQYQEADWAMGTASQRMIGNCPNNNWQIAWRKRAPLASTADTGLLFCSYTINDKRVSGGVQEFQMSPDPKVAPVKEDTEHWFDCGRYAGLQHERTSILLYRPRIQEQHQIRALSTTMLFPLCFGNAIAHLWLGEREVADFTGESAELCDIFVQDGPLYIGLRPLMPRPQSAPLRVRVRRESCWGCVDFYSYDGPAVSLPESDLARIGGGFLCEVATAADFATAAEFRQWFAQMKVVDDQVGFMRQVRYRRGNTTLAMRYDTLADTLIYRMINGREMSRPPLLCNNLAARDIPWMLDDVAGFDHLDWAAEQAKRPMAEEWPEPGRITGSLKI